MRYPLMVLLTISVISVIGFSLTVSATNSNIPEWVKNNAKWWSEGTISESDYITSLEYLIQNGIIDLSMINEVTSMQTNYSYEQRAQSFRVTISNIIQPLPVHFFEKFAFASSDFADPNDPRGRVYDFREINPRFYLESIPSTDKIHFYDFVAKWMDSGNSLNEFDLAVDILDGTGTVIQTWDFQRCEITGYGTYLHDTTFVYSYSGIQDNEIRDRTNFSCVGVSLKTP